MAHAHTDTMDTRKLLQPVVVERPARGREMQTQDFGDEDAADEGRRPTQPEVFHEGYVGDKKFLVPDSNLEAMADMINLKMRRMETSKYVSDSDAVKMDELEDNYLKKKESLFKKLDSLADFADVKSYEEEEEEDEEDNKDKEIIQELPSTSSDEEEEEDGEDSQEKEILREIPSTSSEEEEEEESEKEEIESGKDDDKLVEDGIEYEEKTIMSADLRKGIDDADVLVPIYDHDPNVKHFLISGHFRSNRKPIYIVQQYQGQSVFEHKDPEFFSQKIEEVVDIFIAGEFFNQSILEEDSYRQPISLKTKPRKVVIDCRSRIYEQKFTDVFIGAEVDIELSGSFIKQSLAEVHTPLLSIVLRKGTANSASAYPMAGPTVYVMSPIVENLFEKEKSLTPIRQRMRHQDKGKSGNYDTHGVRKRTGFQYPKGARLSGPMTVYVSQPEIHSLWQISTGKYKSPYLTIGRAREALHETLVLPETSRSFSPRGSRNPLKTDMDLTTASTRKEHIKSLSREDKSSQNLEMFVKSEREKLRLRRQKEKERVTMCSILSQLFLPK